MLNVGSSTREYREEIQPWIQNTLIGPLQRRGVNVVHSDVRDGDGIDVKANILHDVDFRRLKSLGVKSVLCCNMLEHVPDPKDLALRCLNLVPRGGYIVVTVPHSYPHHRDPIDTMFRPRPDEVISLFQDVEVVEQELLTVGSYRNHVKQRPWIIFRHVFRFPFPFVHFDRWKRSMRKLYWLANPYLQSCVILRKSNDSRDN